MDCTKQDLSRVIMQPFPIQFDCNDYHIIIFFEGHPEYESVEAMIRERAGKEPYIRAIITFHDKLQVDHINDREIYDEMKALNINRKICYRNVEYIHTKNFLKNHFMLAFSSYKGEDILLDFYPASKPSPKYAKLIDPLGHSIDTSLPVMLPEKATLVGAKSKVIIKGVQYKIPVKVRVPVFFTGLNGFFSEVFYAGIIRAGTSRLSLIKAPKAIRQGEKWIYKSGNDIISYEIKNIEKNNIIIKSKNEKVELEITEVGLAFKTLHIYSACRNYQNTEFSMLFSPPIVLKPASINTIQKSKSNFSIAVNNHNSLITGTVEIETDLKSIKLLLEPLQPGWATERKVSLNIDTSAESLLITTAILNDSER